jgi:hypothetical protein
VVVVDPVAVILLVGQVGCAVRPGHDLGGGRRSGGCWLEASAHLGSQYRQVMRALAWRRRATGLAVKADRPGYVLEALGPVPASTRGRRAWCHAAAEIEHYRHTYRITDRCGPSARSRPTEHSGPTGSGPVWPSSGSGPSSRPPTAARDTQPTTEAQGPRDLGSSVAGKARSGPPASAPQEGGLHGQPQPPPVPRPAAGRHHRRSAGGGDAGADQRGPPRPARPTRSGGSRGGRVGGLDPDPALAGRRHPRRRHRRRVPRQPAGTRAGAGPRRSRGHRC